MKHKPHPKRKQPPPARKPKALATTTDWHGVSEWYDRLVGDEGSEYHRQVVWLL